MKLEQQLYVFGFVLLLFLLFFCIFCLERTKCILLVHAHNERHLRAMTRAALTVNNLTISGLFKTEPNCCFVLLLSFKC